MEMLLILNITVSYCYYRFITIDIKLVLVLAYWEFIDDVKVLGWLWVFAHGFVAVCVAIHFGLFSLVECCFIVSDFTVNEITHKIYFRLLLPNTFKEME